MRRTMIPLVLAAAVLAAPAGASAAKKPVKLNFKVEGTQTTTWKHTKKQNPTCDWPETGQGKQELSFGTQGSKGVTMEVTETKKGLTFDEPGFLLDVSAFQESSWDRLFSQMSPCPDGGGNGGGDGPNQDARGKATCAIDGEVLFRVGSSPASLYDPGEEVPKLRPIKEEALYFRGVPAYPQAEGSYKNLPAACAAEGQPGADIGLSYGPVEWGGALVQAADRVKFKELLKGKKKTTKIAGQRVIKYPNKLFREPGPTATTGKTTLVLNVTITRK